MTKSSNRAMIVFGILAISLLFFIMLGVKFEVQAETATKVYTVEDLYSINSNMDGDYILMNDIDLSSETAKGGDWDFMGNGWEPIGSGGVYGSTPFTGVFDGNGYAVKGIQIDIQENYPSGTADNIYVGLFSNNEGTIKNLTVKGTYTVVGPRNTPDDNIYCGGIVAMNTGTLSNCYSCVNINTKVRNYANYRDTKYTDSCYLGGISAINEGEIISCGNSGNLSPYSYTCYEFCSSGSGTYSYIAYSKTSYVNSYIGGVIGENRGHITKCFNAGDIVSSYGCTVYNSTSPAKSNNVNVGGIAGNHTNKSEDDTATITDSYSNSVITSSPEKNDMVKYTGGGIVGAGTAEVKNCYVSGSCNNGNGKSIGGTATNCFYSSGVGATQEGATALSQGQMKLSSVFIGFDFNETWLVDKDSDYEYPQLKSNRQDNKDIELVEIATEPTTKDYYVDSEIDPEGGKVKIYYKDGSRETKDITKTMLRGYDMSVIGEQDVTVNYRDFTSTYKINIVERPQIENMTLISEPTKKEFVKGTEFDFTGCQVKVDYVGGKSETIDVIAKATEGGNINKLGNQTITFTLLDKSVEFTVKVIPVEIESIAVENMPTQTVFVEGKAVKTDGLAIKAIYNNGEEQLIDDYVVGELPTSIGKHQIEVSYSGCTTSFEVEIVEKSAVSISIKNEPDKTSYVIGQKLDTTGMVVEATFDNDDVLEVTDYTVGDLPETVGFGKVEIEYQGQKAYVTVSMKEKVLESISVAQLPDKVNYIQDEEFDQAGLKVCANYNNGNSEEITDFTLTNTSTAKAGNKAVTVLYDGLTTTFEITVVEKTVLSITVTPPLKISYIEGEELDTTGMIVKAKFDNGKTEEVTDYEISGFGASDEESNIITVSYKGVSRSFVVMIHTPEPEWRITTPATCTSDGEKKLYCEGCNELLKTETIEALGHEWSEWETVESPNCTDKGSQKRVCSRCQEIEYKDVDPNGHSWDTDKYVVDKEPTCTEEGIESIHCSVCGVKQEGSERTIEALGHNYGEWSVVKEATCEENGREERTCSACRNIDSKEIPAIGHNWGVASYSWSKDNSSVTATRACLNDDKHVETEIVKTTSKVTKKATYTAKGQTTYTAAFTNPAFKVQTRTVTNIPMPAKKVNTMTVKVAKKTVKVKKVKKKAQKVNAIIVTKAQGKVTYKVVGGNAKSKKALKVNAATGKITVKKKTKKGTYKISVRVSAAGTTAYKPLAKTVKVTVKVE